MVLTTDWSTHFIKVWGARYLSTNTVLTTDWCTRFIKYSTQNLIYKKRFKSRLYIYCLVEYPSLRHDSTNKIMMLLHRTLLHKQ
jgi:hypothetical protein